MVWVDSHQLLLLFHYDDAFILELFLNPLYLLSLFWIPLFEMQGWLCWKAQLLQLHQCLRNFGIWLFESSSPVYLHAFQRWCWPIRTRSESSFSSAASTPLSWLSFSLWCLFGRRRRMRSFSKIRITLPALTFQTGFYQSSWGRRVGHCANFLLKSSQWTRKPSKKMESSCRNLVSQKLISIARMPTPP